MKPTQDKYPFFEANQVLTNAHLNQAVDYLDEQERLTRANLIGIGIVCGLEISVDTATSTITVTKGCGISSEGYLIVQPSNIILGRYKDYLLPEEKNGGKYAAFLKADKSQYPLLEVVEDNEDNKVGSNLLTAAVLNDQAVLAFLELKKEGLRNCSPNNCDDKGAAITATVRYLLITKNDLNAIITKANELPTGQTVADLEAKLLAQLNLPDLRLPRYDVPNSNPTTSKELLTAFYNIFSSIKLATQLGDALGKAYEAFKPIVQTIGNPAADFKAKFGFLDNVPTTTTQVQFLQYYYDCFDDLIKAYDEFRWQGLALLCACCPSEKLFHRHLMLGLTSGASSGVYRHHFIASSANNNCAERTKEVMLLFRRLVEMIAQFTDTPTLSPLFKIKKADKTDTQIHITPSKLADVPLSDKAIPYYYKQSGKPPLFELWNAEKTRSNRANQNLSYRSYQYQPVAPVFVTDALRYDLEAYNFLRIEGHLGKNYQSVMSTLLTLKASYRLPIEVIALRTGVFDDTITVDLTKESSRFQDLEALYDVLREELLSNLCEGMMYLYDIAIAIDNPKPSGGTPKMPLLKTYAPNYRYKENTVGAWYEKYFTRIQAIPYIDVDQNAIDANTLFLVYCQLFSGTVAPDPKYYAHIVSIYYFSKLAEILPLSLNQLGYANFENKYQDLLELTRYFRGTVQVSTDLQQFIPQEELIDHFDQVLFSCKLQAIKATHEEYLRRLRELKQKQFLSDFLQKNPAIQHKAGVPLGGTFIIVYHDNPPLAAPPINFTFNPAILRTTSEQTMSAAFTRLQSKQNFVLDADFQLIFSELTGQLPLLNPSVLGIIQSTALDEIMDDTISEFTDGTVIADFYLPYRFNADGQAIQFVLPKTPPTFTVNIGCANADGALVTVMPKGGLSPYSIKIDTGEYQLLGEPFTLASGEHSLRIRDAEDSESTPQTIKVALPLHIALSKEPQCSADSKTYNATFTISEGTPPYSVNGVAINGNSYTTDSIASGSTAKITVMDKLNCSAETTISHTCPPPCDLPNKGLSRRCAYRLWLQPKQWITYRNYKVTSGIKFRFNGKDFDIGNLLQISVDALNKDFPVALAAPIETLNKVVNETINSAFGILSKNRLTISYTPTKTDPFEILWIEHFIEDTFTIEFNFTYSTESIAFALNVRYSNEQVIGASAFNGMILTNVRSREQRSVPAFDCSERNQCEDSAFIKLCEGFDVKPAFVSNQTGEQNLFLFAIAEEMPKTGIAAWVWDFSTSSSEPFYVGNEIKFNWQPGGFIKLTAITDKGCFSSTLENRT